MKRTIFDEVNIRDHFAVAQVVLCLFAALHVMLALMTVMGAIPLGITPEASTISRIWATANPVINILCYLVGYLILARCLDRCTTLVWNIAFGVFITNTGLSVLAITAQHSPYPVVTCGLSIAGAISVWNGREAIRDYAGSGALD
jgi:hypothetical protein